MSVVSHVLIFYRRSAGDEEKMLLLYFNRVSYSFDRCKKKG